MEEQRAKDESDERWRAFKVVCKAVNGGKISEVKEYLVGGGNPNHGDTGGITLLHHAIQV